MTKENKQPKIHPCSLEHYDRYRLKSPEGFIIGVGSAADVHRMNVGVLDSVEFFAGATK